MKFAYFMNTYPVASGTFIRSEIAAHERAGRDVPRFAVRRWATPLVDPDDIAEAGRVVHLIEQPASRIVRAVLAETLFNPARFLRAAGMAVRLAWNANSKPGRNFFYLIEAMVLKGLLKRRNVGRVHAHFSTNPAAILMLCRLLGGPKYSFTVHGPDELEDMEGNSTALKIIHSEFAVAISEYCRARLEDCLDGKPSGKIRVVRCGLDLRAFESGGNATARTDGETLVCVGRLCPQKAQGLLVEAAARILPDRPGLKIILVGDGEDREKIERRIADLSLGDAVTLAGWVGNREVRRRIASARALVMSSRAEGLPIALMESLALRTPVVAPAVAGIPELVDETCGWLFPPGSVEGLADGIRRALCASDEDLAEKGRIGRLRVETLHDQDRNAGELRRLFGAD